MALLSYVIYNSTVGIFQAAVSQEKLSFMAAWWPAHLGVLVVAIAMYFWRLKVNSRYHPLLLWAHFRCAIAFKKGARS